MIEAVPPEEPDHRCYGHYARFQFFFNAGGLKDCFASAVRESSFEHMGNRTQQLARHFRPLPWFTTICDTVQRADLKTNDVKIVFLYKRVFIGFFFNGLFLRLVKYRCSARNSGFLATIVSAPGTKELGGGSDLACGWSGAVFPQAQTGATHDLPAVVIAVQVSDLRQESCHSNETDARNTHHVGGRPESVLPDPPQAPSSRRVP
jgi:hypothetical protein